MEQDVLVIESVEALQAAVRGAVASGVGLVDYGRMHGGVGHRPAERHRVFRLGEGLGGVIEHYERDLAVRVGADCKLGELQERLAGADQWLPLDADPDLPLGEAVNMNVYGPLRLRYGNMRDLLLGLCFVSGEGEYVQVGGRTVKNVAGYDVTKLMVGSMGELGVLTQLTLRTYAVPEATLNVEVRLAEPGGVDGLLPRWLGTDAAPVWLSLMGPEPGGATGRHGAAGEAAGAEYTLRLGYHGEAATCLYQLRSLETLLDGQAGWRIESVEETDLAGDGRARGAGCLWREWGGVPDASLRSASAWERGMGAVVKVVVVPSATGFVVEVLSRVVAGDSPRHVDALPGHGVVFAGGALGVEEAVRLDAQVEHVLGPVGGFRLWHRRPEGAEGRIEAFSPQPGDGKMMRRVKAACDPGGVLNGGRVI